ncbi:MAG: COX15/CtaA family protein, partial [Pseudobdellovibrionaceae bacterium]
LRTFWQNLDFSWKATIGGILLVAIVGSWASLSNTLHPSDGLWEGLLKDFSDDSHYLVKLRFLHPLLASILCFSVIMWKINRYFMDQKTQDLILAVGFFIAFLFGWVTLLFLAPVWMKLVHLTYAHLLWAWVISSIFDLSLQGGSKIQSGH